MTSADQYDRFLAAVRSRLVELVRGGAQLDSLVIAPENAGCRVVRLELTDDGVPLLVCWPERY